jgi:ABC-type multidrug transport system fused ATPase/permease subunit
MADFACILQLLRAHRRRIAFAGITLLFITALGLVPPMILARVIDHIVGLGRYDQLAVLMIILMAMPVLDAVFRTMANYSVTLVSQRVMLDLRLMLYRKVQRLSCRYMQGTTTGKLMERLRGDVGQLQSLLTNQVLGLTVQLLCAMIALVVMLTISVRLTAMVFLSIALFVANYKWFVRRIRAVQRRHRRKMDVLSGLAQERLAGTIVVKAFGAERREAREFGRQNFLAERCFHRFRMYNVGYGITSSSIAWLTYLSVMLTGTWMALHGQLTYGAVTIVGAYTWRLIQPAVQLSELSNQIEQGKVALSRIFELLRAEEDAVELRGRRLDRVVGRVEFEGLHFAYEPEKPVLSGVNLAVKPGMTVAFVGPTGCGKSTMINLLYRYYEPQAGRLLIDGHDVRELDTRWYRSHLALVPQDPVVFDTTIAHNVAYGRPDATREQIEEVIALAELQEVVARLPHGIDTRIGEYGVTLSVGEKQRLCIARAILADPAILLLDEATSSLDPQSEAQIQRALDRLMVGRTSFVIAHRLNTIVHADMIVALRDGRVLEAGSHHELLQLPNGYYRNLYLTQTAALPQAVTA